MKTITHKELFNKNSMELVKEYSEDFQSLMEVLKPLQFTATIQYPIWNHETEMFQLPILVEIKKSGVNPIQYTFYGSHVDSMTFLKGNKDKESIYLQKEYRCTRSFKNYSTIKQNKARKKVIESLAYSLLCDIGLNLHTPELLEDFCDEYGYNIDSIKDENLFRDCIKHTRKLRTIFKNCEQVEFPS